MILTVLTYADLVGVPFVEGGRARSGMDCWGVVLELYRRAGIALKDPFTAQSPEAIKRQQGQSVTQWIAQEFDQWDTVTAPDIGHVVAFRDVDGAAVHVGVVVEPGKFLHALRRTGVVIGKLDREPWDTSLIGAYAYRH